MRRVTFGYSGTTNDLSFPLVQPLQTIPSTSGLSLPGFVAELDGSGSKLEFSTYIGDPSLGAQSLNVVAVIPKRKIHVAGITGWELYTSPGAFIATVPPPPSNADVLYGFVAVFDPSVPARLGPAFHPFQDSNFGNVLVNTSASKLVTIVHRFISVRMRAPRRSNRPAQIEIFPEPENEARRTFRVPTIQ